MKVIADLQIHSRFARAVSPRMTIPVISDWADKKGIDLVATGDWTHPIWFRELQSQLVEVGEGVYSLRTTNDGKKQNKTRFLLSTEISSIYSQGGKVRRIHNLIFAPSIEIVEKINKELTLRGANLLSDGRPIVGLTSKQITELVLAIDSTCLIIPAHAWTPHFSIFGSISGFDSIEECFGEFSKYIYAIETGLSSDPAMNWRIEELANRSIVSFSDAHSPAKMGREATIFELSELTYENVRSALMTNGRKTTAVDSSKSSISSTIEFYPEEGKYHFTGHRNCKIVQSPNETRKLGTICPVCGRALTVGVMSRVEDLAKGNEVETESKIDNFGVRWIYPKGRIRPPYIMMVPLLEILSEALESGVGSKKVVDSYELLVHSFENEFKVLLETPVEEIAKISGSHVGEAISKVRSGDISIDPGYDGEFGKVKIWSESEEAKEETEIDQGTLF